MEGVITETEPSWIFSVSIFFFSTSVKEGKKTPNKQTKKDNTKLGSFTVLRKMFNGTPAVGAIGQAGKAQNEHEGGTQEVGFCFDPPFQFRHIQNPASIFIKKKTPFFYHTPAR